MPGLGKVPKSLLEWLETIHEPALHNVPRNVLLEDHEAATMEALQAKLLNHLDRVQHLIGN